MARVKNPFTPSFGQIPPFMAGREHLINDIVQAFDDGPGNPNLSTIFVGARGTGKTSLLSYLSQEAAAHGWVSANTSAMPGMLDDILQRARESASEFIEEQGKVRVAGISVGQLFGVDFEYPDSPQGNWRTKMNALFKELEAYDIGLLITIDEVRIDLDEMIQFASVYQHFVREGKKVALLMAGLPYKISALLRNDSVSFLRRAQIHQLGRIDDYEIKHALEQTINQAGRKIAAKALDSAVHAIDGFPFMMQLVGFRTWAVHPENTVISADDVSAGIKLANAEMRARILETTYRELSKGDLKFLRAMLPDEDESTVATIAKRMGVKSNYAGQYKRRLLEQGVIGERGTSAVGFDIPGFRELLEETQN